MLEIEVKARVDDLSELREKLLEAGAESLGSNRQEDVYFQHPARDFARSDEALRLRKQEGRCTLTYKGPRIEEVTKTREELKVEVSDFEEAKVLLEKLGFEEVSWVRKHRDYYTLKGFKVMLDMVDGLGSYVEVEKPGESYEPRELLEFLGELGIGEDAVERRSYLGLLLRG